MMNAGNLKGKTRQTNDWRRRMIAFVSALTLLISSCGLTAFAESDEDIYSDPVTAPIPAANTSPEPEEGEAQATPAPEGQPEEGTEPQEAAGEGTEPQEAAGEGTEPEGEPEVSEEPEDLTVYEPGTLTAEADGIGITVDYTAEARVPEGTVLTLTRATGGDLYSALKSASKVLKTEEDATWKRELGEDAVFYAITLTDSEGNEVHPETGVTLTCTNLEIPADAAGFVTGENAENLDWKDTLTVEFLPDAIGYAYLKQVQIGTVTLTHEDRDYMVTAAYGPDAGFPADIELKVREILPGTPEYALYSGMTDEALNEDWAEITLERYFDIAFVANGEELEPKADVDVQIVFRDKIEQNEETEVAAVHIENNEANVIEADTDSTKSAKHDDEAIDTVTFTSDSFSVYGVVQKKKITKKVLAADGKTYDINVSYGPEAEIPEGADLNVREILPEDESYESYLNDAMRAASDESEETPLQTEYARFFDIEIVADGQKVEPKSAVSVSISLTDEQAAEQNDLCVVHFDEEKGAVVLEAEAETASDIQFEAESFSVYGVITYPTAQPQGVADLGGRTFKISHNGNYVRSVVVDKTPDVFEKTNNYDYGAYWKFEATDVVGEYYISTIVGGAKKYMYFIRHIQTDANACLSDTPKAFTVTRNGNGTYTLSAKAVNDIGTGENTYYLKENNDGFAGYENLPGYELTLTFEDTPIVTVGEHYAIIVRSQDGGDYYAVQNDGTLQRVIFYPETNTVKMDYPLFWEYTQTDGFHYNLRIPTLASGFNWQNLPSGYYYRYLDPNSDAGITEEENLGVPADKSDNENPVAAVAHQKYIDNCAMYSYEDLRIKGYDYYLGIDENNMKVIGRASESEAAIVYFVKAENVLPSERQNHTVNHVDIAIEGGASLSVPLDYGDYFYYVGGVRHDLTVDVSNPVTLTLTKDQIDITPEDMKQASITAFSTKTNKVMNDAFYITGYSQNHDTGKTAAQVRIEGSFKVADLEPYNKPENELTYDELQARLNNRVRYTVTVSKKELFQWEYEYEPGKTAQLYSAKTGEELSTNTTVNLSKSFDYWDEENACPPIKDKLYGFDEAPGWREGHIIWDTSKHDGSGMDFELKATVNLTADTVAIHITKEILTTSGEVLHPKTTVNNDFIVYQKSATPEDISAVTTVGMGEGSTAADYTGYVGKHTKRISISSTDDNGTITDYDVDRDTMVCIEENAESIPEYITDAEGAKWKYVRTYIETPYAWRQKGDEGKEHVAEGTKSVPEVLGAYGTYVDDNGETQQLFNRVQEFHVHNVYAKVETITAEKLWQDVSGYTLNESEYIAEYPSITLQLYEDGTADPIPGKDQVLNKDKDWKCEWTDLDADKLYYVKEAAASDDDEYESPIYIVNGIVAAEGTALQHGTVQVVNRKKELKVKLRKCLKGNTKAPVEGAVFEIHPANGYPDNTPLPLKAEGAAEPATSFTSNAEGNFYIGYLPVGTYVIKETEAPSEYTLMDPVEFEILDEEYVDVIQATGVKRYLRYRTWGSTSDGDWQYKSIGDKGYFNLYCEDVPSKTITVTKEWFVNGTETSPSEGSITFDLYRTTQDFDASGTTGANDQQKTVSVNLINDPHNGVSSLSSGPINCYVGGIAKFKLYFNQFNEYGYDFNGKIKDNDGNEYDNNHKSWQYHTASDTQYVDIQINEKTTSLTFAAYVTGFCVEFIEAVPPESGDNGTTVVTTSALPGTRADLSAITEKELVGNYTISASSFPAWTYDSGNTLEKYDYSGATPVEWTYFAIERSVTGYTDTYEYDSDGNIIIKNSRTYTPEGSLKITKVVTVNDAADISTITNGTYSFSVSGVAGTPTAGITHTVSVTFANGKATSYQIDSNEAVTVTGTDNTWSVVLTNLTPGDYTITETSSGPLALKSIDGGKNGTVNLADKSVVATVTDEDYTPTTEAAQVVFTNNINIRTVTVAKAWKDLNGDTASWPQDEENYTPEYVTVKLQRRTAGTSDEYADVVGIATQNIYPENLNDQPTTATFLIPEDEYEYRVVEVNVPAGFVADVAEIVEGTGSYTITNRRVPTIDIEATKRWLNTDVANQAAAVRFELYIAGNDTPIENSERIIVRDSGTTTTENENTICTWTAKAEWLEMPQYVDDTADPLVPVEYEVRETGVYFGTLPTDDASTADVDESVITGWITESTTPKLSELYTVAGGVVEENSAAIINAPVTVDVVVEKRWPDYIDDKYTWNAVLQLKQREIKVGGTEEDVTEWISIENKTVSLSKQNPTGSFDDLDLYHIHKDGSLYRYQYSADEVFYEVTDTVNNKTEARWSSTDATQNIPQTGTYYHLSYIQYAGDDLNKGQSDWYNIVVKNDNEDNSNKLVIHKEWLDVVENDLKYYPEVYVTLYYKFTGENNLNQGHVYNSDPSAGYYYHALNYRNNWEWKIENLPTQIDGRDVQYFVIEEPLVVTRKEGDVGVGEVILTNPDYSRYGTEYQVKHYSYKARSIYGEGEWNNTGRLKYEEPQNAATGATGEILVQNTSPSEYMQMDLKKKILEYRIDNNNVTSLWTTTGEAERMRDFIVELQMLRMVIYENNGTDQFITGWQNYGVPFRIGYDDNGDVYIKNSNVFPVRDAGGTWAFRIDEINDCEGLPKRGFYEKEDGTIIPVRYRYIFKEVAAYDGKLNSLGEWAAWLPYAWDANGQQIKVFEPAEAQDQDRILNVPGTTLSVEKEWIGVSDVQAVYVQVLRRKYGSSSVEDYTEIISQEIRELGSLGQNYMEGNPAGTLDTSRGLLVLSPSNNWSATIHHVQMIPFKQNEKQYEYYIVEKGYKDKAGTDHISNGDADIFNPSYYKWSSNGWVQQGTGLLLTRSSGSNKLKVTNTSPSGSLQLYKEIPDCSVSADISQTFTFSVKLTPAVGKTITETDLSVTGGTKGTFTNNGDGSFTLTVTVTPRSAAVIRGIPIGTTYEVTEPNIPSGWKQTGTAVCDDTTTPWVVAATDATADKVTITNEEITQVTVKKTWSSTTTWPEGLTVLMTLKANGTTAQNLPEYNNAVQNAEVELTSANAVNGHTWFNLPKYDSNGDLITYSVAETGMKKNGEPFSDWADYYSAGNPQESAGIFTIDNTPKETSIEVLKVNESAKLPLSGAQFTLERKGMDDAYAAYPDAEHNIEESDSDGKLTFTKLPDGTYRITETKAPDGYYNTNIQVYFTISDGTVKWVDEDGTELTEPTKYVTYNAKGGAGKIAQFTIGNTPGAELPATGGSGTLIYTITGIFLITLAGTLLVARKRKVNR